MEKMWNNKTEIDILKLSVHYEADAFNECL